MQVQDILKVKGRKTITINRKTSIQDAMDTLISNRISCLPVVDGSDCLIGIISDKDIFRRVHVDPKGFAAAMVGELMTSDVIVGIATDSVSYIAGVMTKNKIRHIPIVEKKKLIGLISVGDVVKSQLENMEIENRYLKQYIDGSYPG